jgi:hypothetical protein
MKPKTLCLLALLACLTGCMPLDSLSPLYTEKDIVIDKTLLGDWVSANKDEEGATLSFVTLVENGKDTGYSVTMSGKSGDGTCSAMEFYGHEIEIGGNKYLDLVVRSWDASTQSYPLQITQSKNGTVITPSLLRLGSAAYMEFNGGKQVVAHLHTAHWFARITRNGDKLRLDWIDDEFFRKAVVAGKFHLAHLMLGPKKQDVVITASTPELQKFIAEHGNDADLFTEHTSELQKKSE